MKKFFILLLVCAAVPAAAFAAPGTAGSRFLLLGIGGRAIGMGGAYAGVADGAAAGYWNPAGLTRLAGVELLSMYNSWFEGINHLYAGLAFKIDGNSAAALQANAVTAGDIPRIDGAGMVQGMFTALDEAMAATYARRIKDRISVGGSIKVIRETIDQARGTGLAFDLGTMYRPSDKLGIGISVQNLGAGIRMLRDTSPLPLVIRAGAGYTMTAGRDNTLTLAADLAAMPYDESLEGDIGGEYLLARMLALRSGVRIGRTVVPAFGVGFRFRNISIDWATELFGDLGNPNRVSLTLKFGKGAQQ
jgi:hypothetical protein